MTARCMLAGKRRFPVSLLVLLAAYTAPPASADCYVARNAQSPVSPYSSWATAASNIQEAVNTASTDATVWISNGIYSVASGMNVVHIDKALTLSGVGSRDNVIIDGQGARRGILVQLTNEGDSVSIHGLTVTNGYTAGTHAHGAGIYVNHRGIRSGAARIDDCLVAGNFCRGPFGHNQGGGLASRGADASGFRTILSGCSFVNNTTTNRDGAGGGAAMRNTHVTIVNCRFEDNISAGERLDAHGHQRPGSGGGLYLFNTPTGSVIRQSVFLGNSCGGGGYSTGGGLSVDGADTAVVVEQCRFENNQATYAGAVSLGRSGQLTLRNCRLFDGENEVFRRWDDAAVCRIESCIIDGRLYPGGGRNFDASDQRKNPTLILNEDGTRHPVRTLEDWGRRRTEAIARIERMAGSLPDRNTFPAPELTVLADKLIEGSLRRQCIEYTAESRDAPRIRAWLFSPTRTSVLESGMTSGQRCPAVLCLHQTNRSIGKDEPAGLQGNPDYFYALELAQRGFVTLAPDFTGSGAHPGLSTYSNRFVSATMKGISDHIRAIDLLCNMPGVDPDRIGCIGHSLGGFNTMMVSVFEPRIRAVVSSCGYVNWQSYADREGSLFLMAGGNYMPRLARHYASHPGLAPFDWYEVVASLAPRPLFVNAPLRDDPFLVEGVCKTLTAARPVYELYDASGVIETAHPDCGHGFPPDVRRQAYTFLARYLEPAGGCDVETAQKD